MALSKILLKAFLATAIAAGAGGAIYGVVSLKEDRSSLNEHSDNSQSIGSSVERKEEAKAPYKENSRESEREDLTNSESREMPDHSNSALSEDLVSQEVIKIEKEVEKSQGDSLKKFPIQLGESISPLSSVAQEVMPPANLTEVSMRGKVNEKEAQKLDIEGKVHSKEELQLLGNVKPSLPPPEIPSSQVVLPTTPESEELISPSGTVSSSSLNQFSIQLEEGENFDDPDEWQVSDCSQKKEDSQVIYTCSWANSGSSRPISFYLSVDDNGTIKGHKLEDLEELEFQPFGSEMGDLTFTFSNNKIVKLENLMRVKKT